ncbi:LPS export ABC transporter periplasmic protein LptC [Altibacter sp. HG106]|uniref:LPS export ABC transporter periplasmic protein LptC n=1 Tax=Altibacter sp. HG106 TaxID=3023937 RepID=UPI002350F4DC|nr:LPS export ABC transporter periplasmic protein LptC [Altibacter sp. HG106]MDC7994264.1 LPS export ABC transporter periplasmic protein LptC [Altibacter sp. HG106]
MNTLKNTWINVVAIFIAITFFACEGNYQNIQKLSEKDNLPINIVKEVNLKYTDSGKLITNLMAPTLEDYSNFDFPYQEFPDGIEVLFWNEKGEKSTVTSKYAIRFEETAIVDLRDSVVLTTSDGNVLSAEQLYWDQAKKWLFTNEPYRITFKDGSYNDGARFDSSEDFSIFLSRDNQGIQIVENTSTEKNTTENGE